MASYEQVDVLLVEDNPRDEEMTLRAFRKSRMANNVWVVRDGEEALDFFFRRGAYEHRGVEEPRLVLLDLKLPKVDGLEVLRELKSSRDLRTVPVVVLTSSRQEQDMVESYALGVNSYIVKPVSFDKFFEAVTQIEMYWLLVNEVPK